MKPIERVKKFIDYQEMSISAFEKAVGLSNNSIQIAIKRNANLKDETLNSILNKYPEIDARWLLTGKGEMFGVAEKEKDPVELEPFLKRMDMKLEKALGYLIRLDLHSDEIKEGIEETHKEVIKKRS